VELVHPVAGIGDEELPDRSGARAVEVQGRPPVRLGGGEVVGGELGEIVPVGPEVVVHDVQDHPDAHRVRAVDEGAEVVRPAVQARGGEQVDAVVAPAEVADEIGDRHHLDRGDAGPRELGQLPGGGVPRPPGRERPDVHLVEDLALARQAAPRCVRPAEGPGVDHLGRAAGALGVYRAPAPTPGTSPAW
jgi:hypothetical protein